MRKLATLLQFRFRTLLAVVAFVAVAVTALVHASPTWSLDLYCAAIVLLTLAIPLAWYRSGQQRAFWAGVALFGWVYLLVIGNLDDRPRIDWHNAISKGPSANVPTSRVTYWIYRAAYGDPAEGDWETDAQASLNVNTGKLTLRESRFDRDRSQLGSPLADDVTSVGETSPRSAPQWWDFLNVGHALWTVVLAFIGGFLVRGIYILRPEESP